MVVYWTNPTIKEFSQRPENSLILKDLTKIIDQQVLNNIAKGKPSPLFFMHVGATNINTKTTTFWTSALSIYYELKDGKAFIYAVEGMIAV